MQPEIDPCQGARPPLSYLTQYLAHQFPPQTEKGARLLYALLGQNLMVCFIICLFKGLGKTFHGEGDSSGISLEYFFKYNVIHRHDKIFEKL